MADPKALCLHKLEQQSIQLDELIELLDCELDALASRNGENLKDLARKKLTLINGLQRIDKEIAAFGDAILNEEEISVSVLSIRKKLSLCQQKNEVNAQAARQAHLSVQQLKEILIGAPTSVTYDQGGSVKTSESNLVRNLKA
ncbi:putative flagellar biosynthesis chaperone [Pseudoalteromonas luteoviolacea B = ATCC 29581]|nr:putative flagellar biosynthesis chaperone [Pseudoalteromonas luteoviolacea B = ATCC 29581]